MLNRSYLKANGKMTFRRNYWRCVLASLIMVIFAEGTISSYVSSWILTSLNDMTGAITYYAYYGYNLGYPDSFVRSMALIYVVLALLVVATFFVFCVLEVGGCRYFLENAYEPTGMRGLLCGFRKGHYRHIVWVMFCRNLFIMLWSFLLIVPGIYKTYEYRMVPYLMADCPDLSRKEAFRISKEMMMGQKWNTFVLDVSFAGWFILGYFTCGVLNILWTYPYRYATYAELFLTLKDEYFGNRRS